MVGGSILEVFSRGVYTFRIVAWACFLAGGLGWWEGWRKILAASEYYNRAGLELLLTALMPENALALRIAMVTGLRIDDVLHLRTAQLRKGQRFTVRESKTGKGRRVYLPADLYRQALQQADTYYVFPGRLDGRKTRTRQAVYKDLCRAARLYRIDGRKVAAHVTPHSTRKVFAVDLYKETGSLDAVQTALNHSDPTVTLLYALSDEVVDSRRRGKGRRKGG